MKLPCKGCLKNLYKIMNLLCPNRPKLIVSTMFYINIPDKIYQVFYAVFDNKGCLLIGKPIRTPIATVQVRFNDSDCKKVGYK